MFLLLGSAWTKVGQPMLNVLQLVRLTAPGWPDTFICSLVVLQRMLHYSKKQTEVPCFAS